MDYHCRQGALATFIEPRHEPLNTITSGGARRTVDRGTLFDVTQHPLTVLSAGGPGRTLTLRDRVFGPALPLLHRRLAASNSAKLKDSGRRLVLRCGTFDITEIPTGDALESGCIRVPENGLRYLLVSDVYDPGRFDIASVLDFLTGLRYFQRFRRGLVRLIEIVHCLSRDDEERLLLGLFHQEPGIYALVTDVLFSIYLFPLLTRRERFEFAAAIDDYTLARAERILDGRLRETLRDSLSRRRRECIDALAAHLADEPAAAGRTAELEITTAFKRFLKDRFSRIMVPRESFGDTIDRKALGEYTAGLAGKLICAGGTALETYLLPVALVRNHVVFMSRREADVLLLFNRTARLEFEAVKRGSYFFVPREQAGEATYIALWAQNRLREGAFKSFGPPAAQ